MFDLVLVKFPKCDKVYLFKAPDHTYLSEGDLVELENSDDGIVVKSVIIYDHNLDELDTLLKATGAKEPLARVKAYYRKKEIDWKAWEEEQNEE